MGLDKGDRGERHDNQPRWTNRSSRDGRFSKPCVCSNHQGVCVSLLRELSKQPCIPSLSLRIKKTLRSARTLRSSPEKKQGGHILLAVPLSSPFRKNQDARLPAKTRSTVLSNPTSYAVFALPSVAFYRLVATAPTCRAPACIIDDATTTAISTINMRPLTPVPMMPRYRQCSR